MQNFFPRDTENNTQPILRIHTSRFVVSPALQFRLIIDLGNQSSLVESWLEEVVLVTPVEDATTTTQFHRVLIPKETKHPFFSSNLHHHGSGGLHFTFSLLNFQRDHT